MAAFKSDAARELLASPELRPAGCEPQNRERSRESLCSTVAPSTLSASAPCIEQDLDFGGASSPHAAARASSDVRRFPEEFHAHIGTLPFEESVRSSTERPRAQSCQLDFNHVAFIMVLFVHTVAIICCCVVAGITYTWPANIGIVSAMVMVGCFTVAVGWHVAKSTRRIAALTLDTEGFNLTLPAP